MTYRPSLPNYGDEFVQDLHLFPFSPRPLHIACHKSDSNACLLRHLYATYSVSSCVAYAIAWIIILQLVTFYSTNFIRRFTDTFTKAARSCKILCSSLPANEISFVLSSYTSSETANVFIASSFIFPDALSPVHVYKILKIPVHAPEIQIACANYRSIIICHNTL